MPPSNPAPASSTRSCISRPSPFPLLPSAAASEPLRVARPSLRMRDPIAIKQRDHAHKQSATSMALLRFMSSYGNDPECRYFPSRLESKEVDPRLKPRARYTRFVIPGGKRRSIHELARPAPADIVQRQRDPARALQGESYPSRRSDRVRRHWAERNAAHGVHGRDVRSPHAGAHHAQEGTRNPPDGGEQSPDSSLSAVEQQRPYVPDHHRVPGQQLTCSI